MLVLDQNSTSTMPRRPPSSSQLLLARPAKYGIISLSHYSLMEMVMIDTRQIHALTDFLRHHKAHVARLKETKLPEVLTVNGRAEVVIQDAASYQELLDRLHHLETLAAIGEGLASAER